jgi:hypothetical protein
VTSDSLHEFFIGLSGPFYGRPGWSWQLPSLWKYLHFFATAVRDRFAKLAA